MRKGFFLLLGSLLFIPGQKSIAQKAVKLSPILTAGQFMKLSGAGADMAEDILPSCFVRKESGTAKTKGGKDYTFINYRRDYKGATHEDNKNILDYDIFSLRNDRAVEFTTSDPAVYKSIRKV